MTQTKTIDRPSAIPGATTESSTDLSSLINLDAIDSNLALIQELDYQKQQLEAQIKVLREGVLLQLQLLKTDKLETSLGKITRYSTSRVKVVCEVEALPAQFRAIVPDTKMIKTAIESGEAIDGCTLESTESIRINWAA